MMRLACLMALSALVFLPGLGGSGRLSYHEAFVAQGAREILDSGGWGYPTIGGLPWLEKPPLPWWLTAALGRCAGAVDETVARLPSVLAAMALVMAVAVVAARHYGPGIGLVSGAVQATTAWTVMRGRLAEADMLLACLITWAIVAFDRMRDGDRGSRWSARWAFFVLLGATSLVKGIGFGAVLILAVVAATVLWQSDRTVMHRLRFPAGWLVAAALALGWPLAMVARHGFGALALWTMHVTDRLAAHPGAFAGEPWWEYTPGLLAQAMPWTPLALIGSWRSLRRAVLRRDGRINWGLGRGGEVPAAVVGGDRLLWAWSVAPLGLLALATVKNAHYAVSAQVPWSIWAALGMANLGGRLIRRGWTAAGLRRWTVAGFAALGLAYGLGFWLLGPWRGRMGVLRIGRPAAPAQRAARPALRRLGPQPL
jgi:4-amino-4-deoxy-L-arabinose transferase-like glycosyltransferase